MEKIIKRLSLIKTSIELNDDIEFIKSQLEKLEEMDIDNELQEIIEDVKATNYDIAIVDIDVYIEKYEQFQLLESEYHNLVELKNQYLEQINHFNNEYISILGDVIEKSFKIKKSELEEALNGLRNDFEKKKYEYEKIKESVAQLRTKRNEIEEETNKLNEFSYEYDSEYEELLNINEELKQKEIVLLEKRKILKNKKEGVENSFLYIELAEIEEYRNYFQQIQFNYKNKKISKNDVFEIKVIHKKLSDIKLESLQKKIDCIYSEVTEISNNKNFMFMQEIESLDKYLQNIKKKFKFKNNEWINRYNLWSWADKNMIPDLEFKQVYYGNEDYCLTGFPRNKEKLVNLTSLDLVFFRLKELPNEIGSLVNLERLNLGINELYKLPKEIGLLVNLIELYIYSNQLRELPNEIEQLVNLETLNLSMNRFHELPKGIVQLINLKTLNLSRNRINKLPTNIGQLVNLETLNLSMNNLKKLPREMGQLMNLETLILEGNNINELPREIKNLKNLKFLSLGSSVENEHESDEGISHYYTTYSGNNLTYLTKDISELINLKSLIIPANELTVIPNEISKLVNLKELDLENNKLTMLPNMIGELHNLKYLNISKNKLVSLPKNIMKLTELNEFILDNNPYLSLTFEFKEWISILEAKGCNITIDGDLFDRSLLPLSDNLPKQYNETKEASCIDRLLTWADENSVHDIGWNQKENSWVGMPRNREILLRLTSLNLTNYPWPHDMRFKKLPKEIGQLTNLTNLNLSWNLLTELPKEIENLINLSTLNLAYNQLEELSQEIGNLVHLTRLNVHCNNLTVLPKNIGKLKSLESLVLSGNKLSELPISFKNLKNLLYLDLGFRERNSSVSFSCGEGNMLSSFPKEIGQLDKLKELYIGSNLLTKIPKDISYMVNLTTLDIGYNQLTELPKEIGKLIHLTDLYIDYNQLTKLPKDIINLQNLQDLYLYSDIPLGLSPIQMKWVDNLVDTNCLMEEDIDNLYKI